MDIEQLNMSNRPYMFYRGVPVIFFFKSLPLFNAFWSKELFTEKTQKTYVKEACVHALHNQPVATSGRALFFYEIFTRNRMQVRSDSEEGNIAC